MGKVTTISKNIKPVFHGIHVLDGFFREPRQLTDIGRVKGREDPAADLLPVLVLIHELLLWAAGVG